MFNQKKAKPENIRYLKEVISKESYNNFLNSIIQDQNELSTKLHSYQQRLT